MITEETKPVIYILIGIPGSGKSTWLAKQDMTNAVIVNVDQYIEQSAKAQGLTYSEVFPGEIKNAMVQSKRDLLNSLRTGKNIYVDQTNLTVKSRKQKLDHVPKGYIKIAVIFPAPGNEELQRRLDSRPGKNLPDYVMRSMKNNFSRPRRGEGFDKVITVK